MPSPLTSWVRSGDPSARGTQDDPRLRRVHPRWLRTNANSTWACQDGWPRDSGTYVRALAALRVMPDV